MAMDPLKFRIRDGCRGGSEQFTWNSIKEQTFKDREQYLGCSMKVGLMGKFGRYYVHDWYAKKRDTAESIDTERADVKAYEEELMQEALGLKPKKLLLSKGQMSPEELRDFLRNVNEKEKHPEKGGREQMGPQKKIVMNDMGEEIATSNEDYVAQAAREAPIKGLGFADHRTAKLEAIKAQTMGTRGQLQGSSLSVEPKLEAKSEEVKSEVEMLVEPKQERRAGQQEVKEEEARRHAKRHRSEEQQPLDREEKQEKKRRKAEKKLKKLAKKEKKAIKREKKAAEQARRLAKKLKKGSDESSSSSSSS